MAVTIGNRLSRPGDWREVEPGNWEVEHEVKGSHGPIHCTTVAFGNSQCQICGEPIEMTPGEIDKCNECLHALQRYKPIQDCLLFSPKRTAFLSWAG